MWKPLPLFPEQNTASVTADISNISVMANASISISFLIHNTVALVHRAVSAKLGNSLFVQNITIFVA